nr:LysE family translocator [Saccharomonospora piscinae]
MGGGAAKLLEERTSSTIVQSTGPAGWDTCYRHPGAATGSLFWGLLAVVGLAALIAQAGTLYQVVRLAGAAYLIYLGVSTLVAHVRRRTTFDTATGDAAPTGTPAGMGRASRASRASKAFATGLLSDLLNPKVGLFYIAVVPQFIPPGASVVRYSLLLTAIEITVAVVWLVLLAWLAHRAMDWLRRPAVSRWLDRTLGVSLVGLGVAAAVDR